MSKYRIRAFLSCVSYLFVLPLFQDTVKPRSKMQNLACSEIGGLRTTRT